MNNRVFDQPSFEQAMMTDHFKRSFLAIFCQRNTLMLFVNDKRRFGAGKFLQHASHRCGRDIQPRREIIGAGGFAVLVQFINRLR